MAVWQSVSELQDGQGVNAQTFNKPIGELASRTDWLKDKIVAFSGDDRRSSIIVAATLSDKDTPELGDIVCVDPATGKYMKAVASMSLYDAFTASEKVFAVGMLTSKDTDLTGAVTLYGKRTFDRETLPIDMAKLVEPGETFATGQYYLSSTTPGKITKYPTGPRILVGFFSRNPQNTSGYDGGEVFLNPQHMDIEAHSHRTFVLLPRPCGESYVPEGEARVFVGGYKANEDIEDSTDSSDSSESTHPRLAVCGDWTANFAENYKVTAVATGSWPATVSWTTENGLQSGSGTLNFYGDSLPVGDYGLHVRLEPAPGQTDETSTFTGTLTWDVGRSSGRGWASASVNVVANVYGTESGEAVTRNAVVRFTGVSDREINRIAYKVPEKIWDLTTLTNPTAGATLAIDGVTYTFTSDPDAEGEASIQILGNVFETLQQVAELDDHVYWYENLEDSTDSRVRILVGASTCEASWGTATELADNTTETGAVNAIVSYDSGESLTYDPVNVTPFTVNALKNGISCMLTGTVAAGDHAEVTIYSVPGATYRYQIEFDNDLKLHFPPVPAKSGSIMLNGVEVPTVELFGDAAVASIGRDSIYWRDNAAGRQPWPEPGMTQDQKVDPEDEYQETFHFVSEFHSETGPVTSLRPAKGSPITVHRCSTDEDATVGDLELDIDLMLGMSDQNKTGYRVPKASRNGKLLLGPVVEKLIAGPGISFSRPAGMPEGQGTFTISADGAAYAGDFETIALENAKLESIGMFPYIRMLKWNPASSTNVPTGFVAKFHVPATIANVVYKVKFYASVFGEESYTGSSVRYAGVTMNYNILPDWTGDFQNANLREDIIEPNEPISLAIPLGAPADDGYAYTAYDPILVHNDTDIVPLDGNNALVLDHAIPGDEECSSYKTSHQITGTFGIRPGYTVAIRFTRSAPQFGNQGGEAYTGAIGFLNLRWSIEEVSTLDSGKVLNTEEVVNATVMRLRKFAAGSDGNMPNMDRIVGILTGVLNALR